MRSIPAVTVNIPFLSGRVVTVATISCMLKTLTLSPMANFFKEMVWEGPFTMVEDRASSFSLIFWCSLVLVFSPSKALLFPASCRRSSFTTWSAVSLASRKIWAASSLALCRIFSLPFSMPLVDSLARCFRLSTSAL